MSGAPKKIGERADRLLGYVSAVVLFAMMGLTFVDVVLRYLFNRPVRGAFEITELMMVILIYAGLPLVSRNDMHVTTDLVDRFLSPAMNRAVAAVVHVVCAVALFGATWLIWLKAGRTLQVGDTTAALEIPLAPFVYLMFVLTLATAIIHVAKALLARPETRAGGGSV